MFSSHLLKKADVNMQRSKTKSVRSFKKYIFLYITSSFIAWAVWCVFLFLKQQQTFLDNINEVEIKILFLLLLNCSQIKKFMTPPGPDIHVCYLKLLCLILKNYREFAHSRPSGAVDGAKQWNIQLIKRPKRLPQSSVSFSLPANKVGA